MKVLWLCNIMIPRIAAALGRKIYPTGGWMTGLLDELCNDERFELCICYPDSEANTVYDGSIDNIKYIGFPAKLDREPKLHSMEKLFVQLLRKIRPDVVHIFGTEYLHTLAMLKAGESEGLLENMAISIQGLVSVYARHYSAALPFLDVHAYSLRDLIKRSNVFRNSREMAYRGRFEIEALRLCKHVIGRTDWDRACTSQIAPDAVYYHSNEILRSEFYKHQWSLDKCTRHTLFISQTYNPIKGMHALLEAMAILKKKYPDIKLYTTGESPLSPSIKNYLRQTHYSRYICKLIRRHGLQDNVCFLGSLNENEMCKQYMNAHVFVSASSIENSPNSLGEAMLIGTPVVSSDVGGVKNMMTHAVEGFTYPFNEYYMLAYYVDELFQNDAISRLVSDNARKRAQLTHDRKINARSIVDIYFAINSNA